MSLHTFTINDKKLGFILDKSSDTPTISKITPGGALEKLLIDSCSSVTAGSEIQYIQDESIKGLSYEKALEKIKSFVERPINIVVTSPRNSLQKNNLENGRQKMTVEHWPPGSQHDEKPVLRKKMTVEEMDRASEEATKLGLKELVRAHKEKQLIDYSSSDDDDNDKVSMSKYNSLENKMHLLKMDNLNMKIENEEKSELMDKQLNPLKLLNDSLCQIVTLNKRSENLRVQNMNSEEMKNKVKKINMEYQEYISDCEKYIKHIELHEIKNCVIHYLSDDQEKMDKFNVVYGKKIFVKNMLEYLQSFSLIVVSVAILVVLFDYSYDNSKYMNQEM
jgi:hypothetical protein